MKNPNLGETGPVRKTVPGILPRKILQSPELGPLVLTALICAILGSAVGLLGPWHPLILGLVLALLLTLPFLWPGIHDPAEPVVLLIAMLATYPLGLFDIVVRREGRIVHNLDRFDAGLSRTEAVPYLDAAVIFIIMGLLTFYAGYYGTRSGKPAFSRLLREEARGGENRIFWIATLVALLATLLPVRQFMALSGAVSDLGNVVELMRGAGRAALEMNPEISTLWIPTLGAINAFWYAFYVTKRDKGWAIKLIFVLHTAISSYMILSLGGRTKLLAFWITLLLIHLGSRRTGSRHAWRRLIIVGTTAAVTVVMMLAWRDATADRRFSWAHLAEAMAEYASPKGFYSAIVERDDFANLGLVAHLIYLVPRESPLLYGESMVAWARWVLPDALKSGSQHPRYTTGHLTRDILGARDRVGGLPPGLIGELYINFHLPGVLAGMFLLGLLARCLYRWHARNRGSPLISFLYAFAAVRIFLVLPINDVSMTIFGSVPSLFMATCMSLVLLVLKWALFSSQRHRYGLSG